MDDTGEPYRFSLLQECHRESAVECMVGAFLHENQCKAAQLTFETLTYSFGLYLPNYVKNQLSVVVTTDQEGKETVVGGCLCEDLGAPSPVYEGEAEGVSAIDALVEHQLATFFSLLAEHDKKKPKPQTTNHEAHRHASKHNIPEGKCLYLALLGVDGKHCRKGLATGLVNYFVENVARKRDFEWVAAEASGPHSQAVFGKLGWENWDSLEYDSFEYPTGSGSFPFAKISDCRHSILFVKRLNPL